MREAELLPHSLFSFGNLMESPAADDEEDCKLVRQIQAGDDSAFDAMVLKHQSLVTGLLHRFAPDRADLEDLVQDAFLRIWRGIPDWKPERPFVHWLKTVTVRVGLEFCRRQKRSKVDLYEDRNSSSDSGFNIDQLPAEDWSTAERARQSLETVRELLSLLPPDDRALLTLLYLNEMPLNEIAGHFGWSLANAKIKAYRARKRLRTTLKSHGYRID